MQKFILFLIVAAVGWFLYATFLNQEPKLIGRWQIQDSYGPFEMSGVITMREDRTFSFAFTVRIPHGPAATGNLAGTWKVSRGQLLMDPERSNIQGMPLDVLYGGRITKLDERELVYVPTRGQRDAESWTKVGGR